MKKLLGILLMISVLFGGCSSLTTKHKRLAGREYILVQENSIPNVLIGFDEHNFYGFSGLNNYFGRYERKGNKIKLEKLGSTLMAGPDKVMKMESEYLEKLDNVQSVRVEDDILIFTLKDGSTLSYKENKKSQKH
ncbi:MULTISPECIES: META domain-containing protein [Cetobacterium]|jgi:heat shock protein HslJ|uniref:META domain-containing protein n=1 Tax=Candidatus Cetobacterium colombiensis TaxID=3073100 RepID=A0ABU4W6B2_9FUSO|nr:META domain-containing protein [Candidatus Cetobacterium colombiensis]MDX8335057.1 META domain-containing protein [Candidatus Cetobacterium colombiensis]